MLIELKREKKGHCLVIAFSLSWWRGDTSRSKARVKNLGSSPYDAKRSNEIPVCDFYPYLSIVPYSVHFRVLSYTLLCSSLKTSNLGTKGIRSLQFEPENVLNMFLMLCGIMHIKKSHCSC